MPKQLNSEENVSSLFAHFANDLYGDLFVKQPSAVLDPEQLAKLIYIYHANLVNYGFMVTLDKLTDTRLLKAGEDIAIPYGVEYWIAYCLRVCKVNMEITDLLTNVTQLAR